MTFNYPGREMLCEPMGLLVGLDKEWRAQGATAEELDLTAFGFDYVDTAWIGNTWPIHTFEEKIIEDNDEYQLKRDGLGRLMKLIKATATIPLPVEYTVSNMDDWLAVKHMFQYDPARVNAADLERAAALQEQGVLVRATMQGGFDLPRELMGEENACLCYYEEPELMQDILDTATETALHVMEEISKRLTIDVLFVHEDMAGKSGPLIGPDLVRQYINPYYRKVWDLVNSRGTRLFAQDSDGDMRPVLDAFCEAGVNLFYPCEPAAGMDPVQLRQQYGNRFAMLGGIDKHVLRGNKEDIRRELEYKLQSSMRGGGMCFGLDHRVPNGVSLENYRYYVQTAREMLGLPPPEKGWARFV